MFGARLELGELIHDCHLDHWPGCTSLMHGCRYLQFSFLEFDRLLEHVLVLWSEADSKLPRCSNSPSRFISTLQRSTWDTGVEQSRLRLSPPQFMVCRH